MKTFALLIGLRQRVPRRTYVAWGLGLAILKFAVDTALVYAFTHKVWSPIGYIVPSLLLREGAVGRGPDAMYVLLVVFALPFLWVGLTMSVRRAADAGAWPWLGTLFLVPLVNYAVIATLCIRPSSSDAQWELPAASPYRAPFPGPPAAPGTARIEPGPRAAVTAVLTTIAIGLPMFAFCVYGLGAYGLALFFLTPFAMGAASGATYNRDRPRSAGATITVTLAGVLLSGSAILLFAMEGLLCLAMAAPIAMVMAILGCLVGRAIMNASRGRGLAAPAFVLWIPGVAFGESHLEAPTPRDVTTAVEIDAPPEKVWPNVVAFTELDEPPAWFFRLGIAYPKRARIAGEGVGAVRRCEFSTGAFVEPITAWSPPNRLAFDVASQPPSMTEWSPYGAIHAPHLEGYMTSKGGEFDLARLPGGRTRLEGTTHYTIAIYPEAYWAPFAEALLHAIHGRVLSHIKKLSEKPAPV
ncbi:MAG: DUF805 domain-containing protein [Polyangiaceae bacterium]